MQIPGKSGLCNEMNLNIRLILWRFYKTQTWLEVGHRCFEPRFKEVKEVFKTLKENIQVGG
jgi:hypothetical protein